MPDLMTIISSFVIPGFLTLFAYCYRNKTRIFGKYAKYLPDIPGLSRTRNSVLANISFSSNTTLDSTKTHFSRSTRKSVSANIGFSSSPTRTLVSTNTGLSGVRNSISANTGLSEARNSVSANIPDQNLEFYRNNIPSRPHGDYIENILTTWRGNYDLLDGNSFYIQWLFPNRKPGVNTEATVLTDKEAMAIRGTPVLKERVFRAFTLMLDFYGMRFVNDQFQLAPNHEERLQELNRLDNHNFLRISRILWALKEFGYSELMLQWMKFLADLIYDKRYLDQAQTSFEQHWITTLDAEDSIQLQVYLKKY